MDQLLIQLGGLVLMNQCRKFSVIPLGFSV